MSSSTIPIILCGKSEQVGRPVIEGLKPEIEVIQFVQTPEAGAAEIPSILAGQTPLAHSSTLGTHTYDNVPVAVVVGAAELYGDEGIKLMRSAVDSMAGARPVAWVRPDKEVPMPPLGPEYGKRVVERVKETLLRLKKEGKLDGGSSEVLWW